MANPRFLHPSIASHSILALDENESHHASRVLRCQPGDTVVIFDGKGLEADGRIIAMDKRCVQVEIGECLFAPRDHSNRLHMAMALPKGDRQRNAIEKMVELGVDSFTPIKTEYSMVSDANLDRLHRYVVEACKQSQRNRLMEIRPMVSIQSLFDFEPRSNTWILHPDPTNVTSILTGESMHTLSPSADSLLFLIGPEGGFSENEVRFALQSGAKRLSLGDRILRVETAVAVAAILGSQWIGASTKT